MQHSKRSWQVAAATGSMQDSYLRCSCVANDGADRASSWDGCDFAKYSIVCVPPTWFVTQGCVAWRNRGVLCCHVCAQVCCMLCWHVRRPAKRCAGSWRAGSSSPLWQHSRHNRCDTRHRHRVYTQLWRIGCHNTVAAAHSTVRHICPGCLVQSQAAAGTRVHHITNMMFTYL